MTPEELKLCRDNSGYAANSTDGLLAHIATLEGERDLLARNVVLRIEWESVTTHFTTERDKPTGKLAYRKAEMYRVLDLLNEVEAQTEDLASVKSARAANTPEQQEKSNG